MVLHKKCVSPTLGNCWGIGDKLHSMAEWDHSPSGILVIGLTYGFKLDLTFDQFKVSLGLGVGGWVEHLGCRVVGPDRNSEAPYSEFGYEWSHAPGLSPSFMQNHLVTTM